MKNVLKNQTETITKEIVKTGSCCGSSNISETVSLLNETGYPAQLRSSLAFSINCAMTLAVSGSFSFVYKNIPPDTSIFCPSNID